MAGVSKMVSDWEGIFFLSNSELGKIENEDKTWNQGREDGLCVEGWLKM